MSIVALLLAACSYSEPYDPAAEPMGLPPLPTTSPEAAAPSEAPPAGSPRASSPRPPATTATSSPRARDIAPPVAMASPLRAGATDDNADYQGYLTFLGTWTDRAGMGGLYQRLNVSRRHYIEVLDASGRPVPMATVAVQAQGVQVASLSGDPQGGGWTGHTYGDGRAAFYPGLTDAPEAVSWAVTVRAGGVTRSTSWDGADDLTVKLPAAIAHPRTVPLDVTFVLDTTGSMGDEIARIRDTLVTTTLRIEQLGTPVDLRYGAVYYRDRGDDYVTQVLPLSSNLDDIDRSLHRADAGGGGDIPESLNEGLRVAVEKQPWRANAAKVAFLIADAPPHMDYSQDTLYGDSAEKAARAGIRVHTVAASGLDAVGTLVFRQIAQLTRGQFIFIEYGSERESAAQHGVTSQFASNNLDDILYQRIRQEVEAWGR